ALEHLGDPAPAAQPEHRGQARPLEVGVDHRDAAAERARQRRPEVERGGGLAVAALGAGHDDEAAEGARAPFGLGAVLERGLQTDRDEAVALLGALLWLRQRHLGRVELAALLLAGDDGLWQRRADSQADRLRRVHSSLPAATIAACPLLPLAARPARASRG